MRSVLLRVEDSIVVKAYRWSNQISGIILIVLARVLVPAYLRNLPGSLMLTYQARRRMLEPLGHVRRVYSATNDSRQ